MNSPPGAMQFVIISDGLPQQGNLAKRAVEQFPVPIDVIYVGRDERGEAFMKDFAHGTGGTFSTDMSTIRFFHYVQLVET